MQPSKYQEAIYKWVVEGRGDAVVQASAGSGKTSTLIEAAKLIRAKNVVFLAFNRAIVTELQSRMGKDVTCKTLNGLGHGAIMRALGGKPLSLQDDKYRELVKAHIANIDTLESRDAQAEAVKGLSDLTGFVMSSLVDPLDIAALVGVADHHAVTLPDGIDIRTASRVIASVLEEGKVLGRRGVISYDDQIYLPVVFGWNPAKSDFVLVDEAQDLSAAKLELALMARSPGGRMLFVGDEFQAIYGFSGAGSDSMAQIAQRTKATTLPLSICYRCPKSVIELAQQIVPSIEAAPNAERGIVRTLTPNEMHQNIKTGDLILCRLTAPLIVLCIELIASRIPARVKGRDIGQSLVKTTKDALGKGEFKDIEELLARYLDDRVGKLLQRQNSETQIQALEDRIAGIRACLLAFNSKTFEEFAVGVNGLFSNQQSAVELSTVHRAKGLEADDVYIIRPEVLPLLWRGQRSWQKTQEMNLRYVAITRAKKSLTFVRENSPSL